MDITIRSVQAEDRLWIEEMARTSWAGEFIVATGRIIYPAKLSGYIALDAKNERAGLITFQIEGLCCEIMTFNAFSRRSGIGSQLLNAVLDEARRNGCGKVKLVTTNDNLDALRFYQRRGFVLSKIHSNSVELVRRHKPKIPALGSYGIPIRDEIELEMVLLPQN